MEFSNREIATYFWLGLFLCWSLRKRKARDAAASLISAFFQSPILISLGLAVLYIAGCVGVLAWWDIWTPANFKTTVLWAISFAFVTVLDINRVTEERTFFAKAVRETFALTGIITFVVELHSFSFLVELISVPLVASLTMLHAVAAIRAEHAKVKKVLGSLLFFIGFGYFIYSCYMSFTAIESLASIDTLRDFGIPFILSLAFLPFLYLLLMFAVYERMFVALHWAIADDQLRQAAKWRAVLTFRHNLKAFKRWARAVIRIKPADSAALLQTFAEARVIAMREANPPPVDTAQGWSPYAAQGFLVREGLSQLDYHRSFDEEWFASSNYLEVGGGVFPNNIGYYMYGTELAVTELKLKLNINNSADLAPAEARFVEIGKTLLLSTLDHDDAGSAIAGLARLRNFELTTANETVCLVKEMWSSGIKGGYSRVLTITRAHL